MAPSARRWTLQTHGLGGEGRLRAGCAMPQRKQDARSGNPRCLRVVGLQPSVDDYRALVGVAGNDWVALREPLLDQFRERARHAPIEVGEILVYEGLLDEAISLADRLPNAYTCVEHVADAAIASHREWVERMARRQAGRILDGANARYYHYAIAWLKRARRRRGPEPPGRMARLRDWSAVPPRSQARPGAGLKALRN